VTNFHQSGFLPSFRDGTPWPENVVACWFVCTGELGSSCKLLSNCMCFLVLLLCNPRFFPLDQDMPICMFRRCSGCVSFRVRFGCV
jgi:hypothetical protein